MFRISYKNGEKDKRFWLSKHGHLLPEQTWRYAEICPQVKRGIIFGIVNEGRWRRFYQDFGK